MSTKAQRFSEKATLSGELDEVPGFGEKGIANLKRKKIHTTYQIIGKFLELDRDVQALHRYLVSEEIGMDPATMNKHTTAQRIADRVTLRGFKCDIKLSDHVIKSTVSMFGDAKKTAFMAKKLTGDLATDFTGIQNVSKFHAAGIRTTDHLFAAFLKIIDDPQPSKNTKKCDEFYKALGKLGAASGWKSAIIYQLQAKLAVGIDSEGLGIDSCPVLPPIPEDAIDEVEYDEVEYDRSLQDDRPLQELGTVEQPRRVAGRGGATGAPPRNLFPDTPVAPASKPSAPASKPSALMYALPVVLAVAVYAWMYWPSSSTEVAVL